jgi:RsmE family RNA methyltransferase
VVLVNAAKVEKSYFESKVLTPAFLDELIDLGLEQARDTIVPRVEVRTRLRPFVEDELAAWSSGSLRLVPHPLAGAKPPARVAGQRVTMAIGPDGGWTPFEIDLLAANGFLPVSLGARVLRVEVAVPFALGELAASSLTRLD